MTAPTQQDLINLQLDTVHVAEVATGKAGGLVGGANIDTSTNRLGGIRKTLPKALLDMDEQGIRNDLLSADGAEMVGWVGSGTGAVVRLVAEKLGESVSVDDFGAVGDGITDDVVSFQNALNHVASLGGGTVTFYSRYLLAASSLTIPDNVWLKGPLGMPGEILPGTAADYDSKRGVLFIDPAVSIITSDMSAVSNCIIMRRGLDLPFTSATNATSGIAAFAGTAIQVGGSDTTLSKLLILGFIQAITSSGNERVRCEYVTGDCANGIRIDGAYDICYLNKCHFWPWTTVHQTWTTNALLRRSGNAYKMQDGGDWNKITDCFSYGYYRGFWVSNANSVTLTGCSADNTSTAGVGDHAGAIGFVVDGNSVDTRFIGCQAAAQNAGYNLGQSVNAHATLTSCDSWACSNQGINITSGNVSILGGILRGTTTGVLVHSADSVVNVDNIRFQAISNAPISSLVATNNIHIGKNDYGDWAQGVSVVDNSTVIIQTLASADPLNIPASVNFFQISGTNNIGTINGGWVGREITLTFADTLTMNDGGASLKLAGNFTTSANSTLRLIHDGVAWCEVSRSLNGA